MLWNIVFFNALPPQFYAGSAPAWLLATEAILRIYVFVYPIFLVIDTCHPGYRPGLVVYGIGVIVYFGSWLLLMFASPDLLVQNTLLLYGPAITPIIWLTGIAIMSGSKLYYLCSAAFIILHAGEYYLRFGSS